MKDYLEDRQYIYRKSYKYYQKLSIGMKIFECIFSLGGITAVSYPLLGVIPIVTTILVVVDEACKIKERMLEYLSCYNFYRDNLLLYKSKQIDEITFYEKEFQFLKQIKYFVVEKYLKNRNLNGYSSKISSI